MSIHRSLHSSSTSTGHRNVLTRTERLEKLEKSGRWNPEEDGVFHLPKVRSIKIAVKKKKKKKDEEGEGEGAASAAE